jgi:hypothetical protein
LLPPPSYLIIKLISNDLGKGKSCGLIIYIKRDIGRIRLILPNTRIIWSEILDPPIQENAFLCAQYTIYEPKTQIVLEPTTNQ